MNKVYFSSKNDDWRTPKFIFDAFMNKGYIDCFPYQSITNQLDIDYYGEKLFINPPYSKLRYIYPWIIKQIKNKNSIYLLVPFRCDTTWFQKLLEYIPIIYFIKGRLHFNDSTMGAPFPSVIMIFKSYHILPLYSYIDFKYKNINSIID